MSCGESPDCDITTWIDVSPLRANLEPNQIPHKALSTGLMLINSDIAEYSQ